MRLLRLLTLPLSGPSVSEKGHMGKENEPQTSAAKLIERNKCQGLGAKQVFVPFSGKESNCHCIMSCDVTNDSISRLMFLEICSLSLPSYKTEWN